MKKSILLLAVLAMAVSCKKVPEGGNKGRLKLAENADRYSEDEHRTVIKAVKDTAAKAPELHNPADSTGATVNATAAPQHNAETTVNTMSAPVNNAKTDTK